MAPSHAEPSAAGGVHLLRSDLDLTVRVPLLPGRQLVVAFRSTDLDAAYQGTFACREVDPGRFDCTVRMADLVPGIEYELTAEVVGEKGDVGGLLDWASDSLDGVLAPSEPILVERAR